MTKLITSNEPLAEEILLLIKQRQAKMEQTTQRTNEVAIFMLLDELMTMTPTEKRSNVSKLYEVDKKGNASISYHIQSDTINSVSR